MDKLVIVNARVVTANGVLEGGCVLLENGGIALVSDAKIPGAQETIDARGCYLVPGFIDLHSHGRLAADVMDGKRETFSRVAADQLRHGVTGFLITTQSAPIADTVAVIEAAVAYMNDPAPEGALPLGIYLEGPFFASAKKGAQRFEETGQVDLEALETLLRAGDGAIRIVSLAPELENAVDAVRLIQRYGAVAAAGHTNSNYADAMQAIEAGLCHATHTFNAMKPINHREPSVIGACLTDSRVICEAIADGIHLHPAIVALLYKAKGPSGLALISDSVAAAGLPPGLYDYGDRKVRVDDAVWLVNGTLAGSVISLDSAFRNVMQFAGCSMWEAAMMASTTPAHVIGLSGAKGTIAAGMDADLVLLDADFHVKMVFLGGRPISAERK